MTAPPDRTNGRSLSLRLFRLLCAGVAAVYLVLLALGWAESRLRADATQDRLLRSATLAILERVQVRPDEAGQAQLWVDLPAAAFDTLALAPDDRVFYRLRTRDGRDLTGDPDLPPPGAPVTAQPRLYTQAWSGEPVRFIIQSRPLLTARGEVWVSLQLGQTRRARDAEALRAFGWSALGLTLVAALCLALVPLAARRALAPLHGLSRTLEARPSDTLAPLPGPAPQEVAGLIAALNGFMARLGAMQARSERFIADVSHQIRTGINALDAQLQMADAATDPDEARARLHKARAQSARTMRLTNQLLSQAMVIHRADARAAQPLAPRPLLRDVLSEMLQSPRMAGVDLALEDRLPDPAPALLGDPVSLREALRNLLENAVQHGGDAVAITVHLQVAPGGGIRLGVCDTGPGLPVAARVQVLDRFAVQGASGGTGLGLAIVAEVARAHGATLRLEDAPGGGLAVWLDFPAAPPQPAGRPGTRLTLLAAMVLLLPALPGGPARAQPDGQTQLTLWSATDEGLIAPVLDAFRQTRPDIAIRYRDFSTQDLYQAVLSGAGGRPDLVISPAVDLQVQLVNRGLARPVPGLASGAASAVSWRDELFGFTLEPEVIVLNTAALQGLPLPQDHAALADLIRDHPQRFADRLGSYDIRTSGIGYLLSAQASALGPDHARLTEVMGRTGTRLYATTAEMVQAVAEGQLHLATGVLGSYAAALLRDDPRARILMLGDYNLAVPRTGFITRDAAQPAAAAALLRYLLSEPGQAVLATAPGLAPLDGPTWLTPRQRDSLLILHPGPGMLLWQDSMKRRGFLSDWARSIAP